MQIDTQNIEIEYTQKNLQYYSYLRAITEQNEMPYWIGNPSVEITSGMVTLAPLKPINKEEEPDTFEEYLELLQKANKMVVRSPRKVSPKEMTPIQTGELCFKEIGSKCLMLCGIPNTKSPVEVMETYTVNMYRRMIVETRVVKTENLRYYGMFFLFDTVKESNIFFNELFAQSYNDIELERVILREMVNITISFSELPKEINQISNNTHMHLLRKVNLEEIEDKNQKINPQNIFTFTHLHNPKNSQLKLDKKMFCVICLQEIDTCIVSILCGHYFDWECLERWSQNTCPLCRYHQQPPIIKFCELCNQCQGLWVCLICGVRLCCGANDNILATDSHIYLHYKETQHSLSMQLETKFLFDAKVPAFLHQMFYKQIIRNGGESKLMMEKQENETNKKNKITDMIAEYENQVSQQMNKQRAYFEEAITKETKQHQQIIKSKRNEVYGLREAINNFEVEEQTLQEEREAAEKQLQKLEKETEIVQKLKLMHQAKAENKRKQIRAEQEKQKQQIIDLEAEIENKRQQLDSYRHNIKIKNKIQKSLGGEIVDQEVMFLNSKTTKGKKK